MPEASNTAETTAAPKVELRSSESLADSLINNSSAVGKATERNNQPGKRARAIKLDVDGTVYHKVKNAEGKWTNVGNNAETSQHIKDNNEVLILDTGIPRWKFVSDSNGETPDNDRMASFQLDPANIDVVSAGGGTIIYWKNENGDLVVDPEWQKRIKEHKISYQDETDPERVKEKTAEYNPQLIRDILQKKLLPADTSASQTTFSGRGLENVRIDMNANGGYATLDVTNMTREDFQRLRDVVRTSIKGVKVEFTERLDTEQADKLNGWALIVPVIAGKSGASRYIFSEIAKRANPDNLPDKKLETHTFGDASIDIDQLLLGAGKNDPYEVNQYALKNVTPYAKEKITPVQEALRFDDTMAEVYRAAETSESVGAQKAALSQEILRAKEAQDRAKEETSRETLRQLSRGTQIARGSRAANIQILDQNGSEGVRQVIIQLPS